MFYCFIFPGFFFKPVSYILHRLNCSIYNIGLLNPTANPETYQDINCPCNDFGAPICPANATQGELFHYGSVSYDEFFDLADKNISTWILRTHEEFNEIRYV